MKEELKNSFDEHIRSSMSGFEVPYDEGSWEMLASKMDMDATQEAANLDQRARDALSTLSVPYADTNWKQFEQRLNRARYRRRLIATKVFEAAVILLAVLTLVKFVGHIPEVQEYLPKAFVQQESTSQPSSSESSSVSPAGEASVQTNVSMAPVAKTDITTATVPRLAMTLPTVESKSKEAFSQVAWSKPGRSKEGIAVIGSREIQVEGHVISLMQQDEMQPVPVLPVFNPDELQAETATDFQLPLVAAVSKVQTDISVYHQRNTNTINNFYDGTFREQKEQSLGAGIAANVQFGTLGFELGASYDKVEYLAGNRSNRVHKLQLPLNLKYVISDRRFSSVYAKAGASLHAAMQAHYEASGYNRAAPGARKAAYYNDGLLKNGHKDTNLYSTWNVGLGVSVPVVKGFSAFVEGVYHGNISGKIGYTDDRFQTFAINTGMAISL